MQYRREIDGLRALAVIPVILFHAEFDLFSGGFVGVDIFFVISGFLITSILLKDIENKKFNLLYFYERRARRILPALFFIMILCIPFAWFWMTPVQTKDFSESLAAVSLFISNILFLEQSGYFAANATEIPLLHTWSLAVEEQFYIFFPLLLVFLWKFGKRVLIGSLILISIASLGLSEWAWRYEPDANFYLILTRAWELLSGALAAIIIYKNKFEENNFLSILGLGFVIFSILFFDQNTPFPSVYALIPILGVVLIILFTDKGTISYKILSSKLLVGIGLISYSAYLWHQPLFAFVRIRSLSEPSILVMSSLSLASLILAYFSWKFIELPFRQKNRFSQKNIFLYSALGIFFFISITFVTSLNNNFENRFDQKIIHSVNSVKKIETPYGEVCTLGPKKNILAHPIEGCTNFFVNKKADILLLGDSHLESISFRLQEKLFDMNIGSYSIPYSGCIPIPGFRSITRGENHKCHEHNLAMLDYARKEGINTIILVSRFPWYLEGTGFDNKLGGVETKKRPIDVIDPPKNNTNRISRVEEAIKFGLNNLLKEFNVIFIEPVPEVGWSVPDRTIKLSMHNQPNYIEHEYNVYKERNKRVVNILNKIDSKRLYRLKTSEIFCDAVSNICNTSKNGNLLYTDNNHLSKFGSEIFSDFFLNEIPILDIIKN